MSSQRAQTSKTLQYAVRKSHERAMVEGVGEGGTVKAKQRSLAQQRA